MTDYLLTRDVYTNKTLLSLSLCFATWILLLTDVTRHDITHTHRA
jgi:hypothetical protein